DPNNKCVIEGHFNVSAYQLEGFFAENDLDYENDLIVRREITPSGKSRAFINDTPANLKVLQQLGSVLIDLHQQFDTLYINNVNFQLQLLDALAEQQGLATHYYKLYRELQETERKLSNLLAQSSQAQREQEFLQFQFDELSAAELLSDEQEQLENEQNRLGNADEIKQLSQGIFQLLTEDDACINDQLLTIQQQLAPLATGSSRLNEMRERFVSLQLELEALSSDIQAFGEETENNPERLQEVQERLDLLYRLQSKHNVTSNAALLDIQGGFERQLSEFADLSGQLEKLKKHKGDLLSELQRIGSDLSAGRQRVAPNFSQQIKEQLAELAMPNAQLVVDFQEMVEPGPYGLESVRFLFSANKGSRLLEIKDAASGGEMSRLALVTKSLVASAMALPTLVFDEIDSGVSGDVARQMGHILSRLSQHHQVVVITHSPQVASRADRHFFIYKTDLEKEDRTITKVRELDHDQRIRAIATMLSQNPPSASALENARELIDAT
ncbi:MAG: DNA repair protein RecN, partial [Bacteroidota bacterium]